MKKILLTVTAVALGMTIVFVSCKKEEEVVIPPTYGAISGTAFANLNQTNDTLANGAPQTQLEEAPSGTKVIARVSPANYSNNPDPNVNYEFIVYEAIIGSSGDFLFDTIRAYGTNVNVELIFSDFAEDTKVWGVDANNNAVVVNQHDVYQAANVNVPLVANGTQIVDVTYN